MHVAVGKRKDNGSCEKCRHLERGTNVPDGRIPQREEVEMVRTCAKAEKYEAMREMAEDRKHWHVMI